MIGNLAAHLKQLLRFSGREGVKAFWTYALFVIAGLFWALAAVMMPIMAHTLATAEQIARTHPEDVTVSQGPGQISVQVHGNHPEMMPDFETMTQSMWPIMVVGVVLLAAAVARRLHDRGRSGLWGLLPLPFLVTGLVLMPRIARQMMAAQEPDMTAFFALFVNNMLYLASLGLLVFLLIKPGDPAANRWGEPPADSARL